VRVLMISKACIVGMYQQKLATMASRAQDLALTVVVPPYWRDERGETQLERVYTQGYRMVVLPMGLNGSFHTHFYPGLRRLVAQEAPDIVHIDEEPYNLATLQANLIARRYGAKTLWFSWQNLARRYPPPFSWIETYNLKHVDHALVGSRTSGQVWRAKGYAGDMDVIPQFGVDPDVFTPPPPRVDHETVHIAYVGRLVPEKGCDVLLDALVGVTGRWRATFLGSGPSGASLRHQASAQGLSDRVSFLDWVASTEMPAFYRKVDVLVLPSLPRPNWTEQFGRVLIEAMASEVAVVGSGVGEIPHVIGDGGVAVPPGDATTLADALQSLIDDPAQRVDLGRHGRRRVLTHFTHQSIADATLAVYRKLVL